MGYFCLECGEIYRKETSFLETHYEDRFKSFKYCPRTKCNGEVIEVDDMFLPAIRLLNQKGYNTEYCCSGHTEENGGNSYISFSFENDDEQEINLQKELENLLPLPNGYKFDMIDIKGYCIRRNYSTDLSTAEFHKEILKNALATLIWAENLPDISEEKYLVNRNVP